MILTDIEEGIIPEPEGLMDLEIKADVFHNNKGLGFG
jgi:hypothetical protein